MFVKKNVSVDEYNLLEHVHNFNIVNVPKPMKYDPLKKELIMEKIPELNISDTYGEEPENVPEYVFDRIRIIIKNLYENDVIYPDITGYNFIEWNEKIWIIDFGDAYHKDGNHRHDPFVRKFIKGYNGWNPYYK